MNTGIARRCASFLVVYGCLAALNMSRMGCAQAQQPATAREASVATTEVPGIDHTRTRSCEIEAKPTEYDARLWSGVASGEARGDGVVAMIAVLKVMKNRLCDDKHRYGMTASEVALRGLAFSVMNEGEWSRNEILRYATGSARINRDLRDHADRVLPLARAMLLQGWEPSIPISDRAMHYYNPDVASPAWAHAGHAAGPKIGHHVFLEGVDD